MNESQEAYKAAFEVAQKEMQVSLCISPLGGFLWLQGFIEAPLIIG